ncbi:beta-L-arabinofuranosidase domain-containing protein [Maribellus sp. YY47]|uniref:glycoside hydrolase family 127 protein n=1 Tax=Maribellus sp. YY47 TaxID=2929486 RepID=UPI002000BF76|nr:beta-L-arabinofuranosidase domain-containing protein [Maribellus sp. YY47]MCK3685797.1 glycoside hydrolase family 127 protein [Maribellus sp. YY47]
MKYYFPILLFAIITQVFSTRLSAKTLKESGLIPISYDAVKLQGYPGQKIDLCISEQIKKRDVEHLVEPFRHKTETRLWQSEFWGKWMLSAVAAWKYTQDEELMNIMKTAVDGLLETQLENGYIGNYAPESQLTQWDIWGRKYSMLGLIRYYEISKDRKALKAAQKVADHLLTQVGPGKKDITYTGNYHGMASSSVLEPIVYLYKHTGEQRYLDFASYIVQQWENEDGPKLISKAVEGVWVSERFPHPDVWWSWDNGQKAYEMMSCYEGLLQLYLVNQNPKYLKAVVDVVENIINTEINVAGSGSAFECWYHGIENQTRPTYHTMETCVTMTWMKLCYNLLQVTGEPHYADQIEKTFYNALMASMEYNGNEIAKYSPLEGRRHAGEQQCGMHINCCNANGPRGFTLMPGYSYMTSGNTVFVNFYCQSEAQIKLAGNNEIIIRQTTTYPESGRITFEIQPEKEASFELALRIPAWSEENSLKVNNEKIDGIVAGTYQRINRTWNKGDKIELTLDLRGRLVKEDDYQAIMRGPVVLARDSRFNDGFVDEAAIIRNENGIINLEPVADKPKDIWMAFTAPLVLGTDLEGELREPQAIRFCDFASAGNTWNEHTRYKVWIRETLNAMKTKYSKY